MSVWQRLMDGWDRDWKGQSFNGRCLMEELSAHSAQEASTDRTVEGYTVWSVALHVHRYKELMLAQLEGRAPVWPEGDDDFPALPEGGLDEKRWIATIHHLDATHQELVARARTLDEAFLETVFEPWQITWAETFVWAAGHDGYHTAQIRNMKR